MKGDGTAKRYRAECGVVCRVKCAVLRAVRCAVKCGAVRGEGGLCARGEPGREPRCVRDETR
ncbi:hypothetical protein TPA0598_02_06370 [Streptomyces lydicamycinicus]|uniref:Uncharacterized protein n=1 Tax=Streptomyces lydicamycinicus TaxID=1546107 RepID=A0A0P4R342_9ACTN|nr:hypothetical protein TPA0598_02_06370 [Streptomyces lydicamycinicus]